MNIIFRMQDKKQVVDIEKLRILINTHLIFSCQFGLISRYSICVKQRQKTFRLHAQCKGYR